MDDDFNHRKASDILREMDASARAEGFAALDQRIVKVMGAIMVPAVADYVKELRAANAALAARVTELETKLAALSRPQRVA